jgi:hypothetical protein
VRQSLLYLFISISLIAFCTGRITNILSECVSSNIKEETGRSLPHFCFSASIDLPPDNFFHLCLSTNTFNLQLSKGTFSLSSMFTLAERKKNLYAADILQTALKR